MSEAKASVRPTSIVWYERLSWAAIALSFVTAAADPTAIANAYNKLSIGYPIMVICGLAAQLFWIWLIAWRRKNWARWVSLVVVVVGGLTAFRDFDERFRHNALAATAHYAGLVLLVISVVLLFRSDARGWFVRQVMVPDLDEAA
jgi:multidrug transporter EmrE-like cation transporter